MCVCVCGRAPQQVASVASVPSSGLLGTRWAPWVRSSWRVWWAPVRPCAEAPPYVHVALSRGWGYTGLGRAVKLSSTVVLPPSTAGLGHIHGPKEAKGRVTNTAAAIKHTSLPHFLICHFSWHNFNRFSLYTQLFGVWANSVSSHLMHCSLFGFLPPTLHLPCDFTPTFRREANKGLLCLVHMLSIALLTVSVSRFFFLFYQTTFHRAWRYLPGVTVRGKGRWSRQTPSCWTTVQIAASEQPRLLQWPSVSERERHWEQTKNILKNNVSLCTNTVADILLHKESSVSVATCWITDPPLLLSMYL